MYSFHDDVDGEEEEVVADGVTPDEEEEVSDGDT